ncbi:alpha-S2-casein-like [Molossus nigricans]
MKFFVFTCLLAVALAKHKTEHSSSSGEHTSSSSSENKINEIYQKLNFLQYLQALRQPQIVINPQDQIRTSAYPFYPTVEIPKSVDMETKLIKENKNILKLLNKMAQYYQKFPLPQYFNTVPSQRAMKPWNPIQASPYQVIPTVV